MIKPLRNNSYHNQAGRWDMEIDFEDDPKGEDKGCDLLYYKIHGPKQELFTYLVKFTGHQLTVDGPDPGNLDQDDLKHVQALHLVRVLIKKGKHADLVATHKGGQKYKFSKPPEPLIHHSEGVEAEPG
ncbi:MAG: hypothetical protein V3W14_08335 [Candidatus Neomarinimicrobiota bacterium]